MVEKRVEKDAMEAVKMAWSKAVLLGRFLDEAKGMIAAEEMECWMVAEVAAMMVEKEVCWKVEDMNENPGGYQADTKVGNRLGDGDGLKDGSRIFGC